MMNNSKSIRSRIVVSLITLSTLIAATFSLFNFMLVYMVEDQFLESTLKEEASRIINRYQKDGEFPSLSKAYFSIYHHYDELPSEIRAVLDEEPERVEVPGKSDRHYHIYRSHNTSSHKGRSHNGRNRKDVNGENKNGEDKSDENKNDENKNDENKNDENKSSTAISIEKEVPHFILVAEVSKVLVVRPIRNNLLIMLSVFSLLMVIFAAIVGYWLASKTTRPLRELTTLVENTKPDSLPKDFSERFSDDETALLAQALEISNQRIQQLIEREKSFTRDASHELRTPITVIKGATELLATDVIESKPKAVLNRIVTAVSQMELTVSTLLALARNDIANKSVESYQLLEVVERVVIDNAYLLEGKEVEVEIEVLPTDIVKTTTGVLEILLTNLIGNAFQYTSKGLVKIAFANNELTVVDSGNGISAEIMDKVTEPLVKGEESKGFGMGLSIVKRLCEKLGLALSIKSNQKGTRAAIKFD